MKNQNTMSSSRLLIAALLSLIPMLLLTTTPTASPIVNSYNMLDSRELPLLRHFSRTFLREPMPWEDGYFDPSYHAWPKNRQQQVLDNDKQSVKLTSDESVSGKTVGAAAASNSSN